MEKLWYDLAGGEAVILFWLAVLLVLLLVYGMVVVAGLFDLTSFLPRHHPLRRLTILAARPFRGGSPDEEAVDEMARRLRGGPGAWPVG
ncbi:MAG: hypothetical protein QN172_11160 [Armatimonadota bacterium]|nr:hypothetical protein [Armatimonadota bacterium]MDR7602995.1 hypothetical protein [Armatimonadota bacterium]